MYKISRPRARAVCASGVFTGQERCHLRSFILSDDLTTIFADKLDRLRARIHQAADDTRFVVALRFFELFKQKIGGDDERFSA